MKKSFFVLSTVIIGSFLSISNVEATTFSCTRHDGVQQEVTRTTMGDSTTLSIRDFSTGKHKRYTRKGGEVLGVGQAFALTREDGTVAGTIEKLGRDRGKTLYKRTFPKTDEVAVYACGE